MDDFVRSTSIILDAKINFGPVNRATHGPVLGDTSPGSEIDARILQDSESSDVFCHVYMFPIKYYTGRPDFFCLFGAQIIKRCSALCHFPMGTPVGLLGRSFVVRGLC